MARWWRSVGMLLLAAGFAALAVGQGLAADAPRMTKEELKPLLGQKGVVIVDTRLAGDWGASEGKVAGAVREDPSAVRSWATKYPKDAKIVVYCA